MSAPKSVVVWEGASRLDRSPVALVLTGFGATSANSKTGAMLQSWIIRGDVHPVEAVKTGADAGICGDCPLRPVNAKMNGGAQCYVNKGFGPAAVYRTLEKYPRVSVAEACRMVSESGLALRIGTYGDPAAVPARVIRALQVAAGGHHTGYTHQWRKAELEQSCMASVGSHAEAEQAHAKGFRTFRVRRPDEPLMPHEIACPASEEAGKRTTCANCQLCNGSRGAHDKRKNIAIIDHGPTAPRKKLAVLA